MYGRFMEYKRPLHDDILRVYLKDYPVIQAMVGPRQVGKTTLARQLMAELDIPGVYASADAPLPPGPEWIETQWRLALHKGEHAGKVLLVLDEIQKVQGWSEILKFLWDNRTGRPDIKVLILGSSSLLVQKGLTESLSGRFFLHYCPHWSFAEMKAAFGWNLNQWILLGGYPGSAPFIAREEDWKAYIADSLIDAVLNKDIFQLQTIAKPALFRQLFFLAASCPARIFSYNKMLGQLQEAGNTTTLAHYLKLMQSAFLVSGLNIFSRGVARKKAGSPKLILWNNALITAASASGFQQTMADTSAWGRLVENAVGAHLANTLPTTGYELTYWRSGNHEVDFVISRADDIWALEVKSGGHDMRASGLSAFKKVYPRATSLIIGGSGIPLEDFFSVPAAKWLRENIS
jgi:uncharacterized protein